MSFNCYRSLAVTAFFQTVQQLAEIICLFLITVENSDQKQGCLPDQEALNEPSILAMLKKMALRA